MLTSDTVCESEPLGTPRGVPIMDSWESLSLSMTDVVKAEACSLKPTRTRAVPFCHQEVGLGVEGTGGFFGHQCSARAAEFGGKSYEKRRIVEV